MADAPLLLYTNPDTFDLYRRRWRLVVVDGDDRGAEAELEESPALVGAAPAASLVLSDDTVSRYHAEVDVFADGLRIRDLDSTNGTFVGGDDRVREGFVENGGTFRVGRTTIRLIAVDEPATSEIPTDPRFQAPDGILEIGHALFASPLMRALIDNVRRVAASASSVLLRGEPGTGRAALARIVHDMSPRRRAAFVSVHAGALDRQSHAQLLFGRHDAPGLFSKAHRGTLFIEDVDLLHPEVQAAVLHTIRRGEVRPVTGDDKVARVDVRILSSTSVALRERKDFDRALFRRLAVVELVVPPLRDRFDDVLAVVERKLSPAGLSVGPKTRDFLMGERWMTNLDELHDLLSAPLSGALEGPLLDDAVRASRGDVSAVADRIGTTSRALFGRLHAHAVDLDAVG